MASCVDDGRNTGVVIDSEAGLRHIDLPAWGLGGMRTAGQKALAALAILGDVFAMMCDAVWSTAGAIVHRRFSWSEFAEQSWFLVSVTILPTILIAIPFGLVLVLEVGGLAVQIGANGIVGAVDAIGIVREAAPVITAIILSGAGGSAICSDLGSRTMRDEISAMWVMAVDPVERLVAPRVLATVVVALLLNGVVAFAGIMSGTWPPCSSSTPARVGSSTHSAPSPSRPMPSSPCSKRVCSGCSPRASPPIRASTPRGPCGGG